MPLSSQVKISKVCAPSANPIDARIVYCDGMERPRSLSPVAGLLVGVCVFAVFYASCSLLIHASFHSMGWDLGIFEQVIWNSAHGHLFEYSFRPMTYNGDHFSPLLFLFIPFGWLNGPEGLLVFQALVLAAAAVPLFFATRRMAGLPAATGIPVAWFLSLGVARAVAFDFHTEAVSPLLAFTALWAMVDHRPRLFVALAAVMLLVKEDGALLVLALCWVAWLAFGWRRLAWSVGAVALAYGLIVALVVLPHFRGPHRSPLSERYAYFGDTPREVLTTIFVHPHVISAHLIRLSALDAVGMLLLGVALLPLTVPRLLLPLALILVLTLLSASQVQADLSLHYMLVPATLAMVLAAIALRDRNWEPALAWLWQRRPRARIAHAIASAPVAARNALPDRRDARWRTLSIGVPAAALAVLSIVIFVRRSPLPPSFDAHMDTFTLDAHTAAAASFVREMPAAIPVSAQANFVPHLANRRHIYEFPQVRDADWVLLDSERWVPGYDAFHYDACRAALPSLGFEVVRHESGITLWHRARTIHAEADQLRACSIDR